MSNLLPEHQGFTFTHETYIEIPFHRTVMVDSEGNYEVIQERIPMRPDTRLAAESTWELAGAIQRRTLDQQTAEEVTRQIAIRKANTQITRAEEEA